MGCHVNISAKRFPKQGDWVGKPVRVCFHYNTREAIGGVIVREDEEEPGVMIIQLSDGRYVLATECQYSFS